MYNEFSQLLKDLAQIRPTQSKAGQQVFFYNDQPVLLKAGTMEDLHWVDIHIELLRFHIASIPAALKVLKANEQMGSSTPIPTWFGVNEKDNVVFINRLDWRHITAKILDDHIMRCVDQMSSALLTEGV